MRKRVDERVLLVGTGLIGGSIGLALREARAAHVAGFDASTRAAERAKQVGAVDEVATSLEAACSDATSVVVCTPVGQIAGSIAEIAASAREGTLVTDVGSTKASIVREAERILGPARPFVGGHPMAGTEREGIEAARPDLFRDALWILTPTATTDAGAFRRAHALVSATGARVLALEPAEHDRLVALVSHLPYAIATTLMDLAGAASDERVFRAAAGSFRDVTRTAGSSPHVWRDILRSNREAVLHELEVFGAAISSVRGSLQRSDWDAVDAWIERARAGRRRLPLKGERGPAVPVTLEVPVPDRTGVLADLTTAIGSLGVNIEDLRMEHAGAGGVVEIVVDGEQAARDAVALLRERGYRASILMS